MDTESDIVLNVFIKRDMLSPILRILYQGFFSLYI